MLDFNQARTITMDDTGVEMAVEACGDSTTRIIPSPLRQTVAEQGVWTAFVVYL